MNLTMTDSFISKYLTAISEQENSDEVLNDPEHTSLRKKLAGLIEREEYTFSEEERLKIWCPFVDLWYSFSTPIPLEPPTLPKKGGQTGVRIPLMWPGREDNPPRVEEDGTDSHSPAPARVPSVDTSPGQEHPAVTLFLPTWVEAFKREMYDVCEWCERYQERCKNGRKHGFRAPTYADLERDSTRAYEYLKKLGEKDDGKFLIHCAKKDLPGIFSLVLGGLPVPSTESEDRFHREGYPVIFSPVAEECLKMNSVKVLEIVLQEHSPFLSVFPEDYVLAGLAIKCAKSTPNTAKIYVDFLYRNFRDNLLRESIIHFLGEAVKNPDAGIISVLCGRIPFQDNYVVEMAHLYGECPFAHLKALLKYFEQDTGISFANAQYIFCVMCAVGNVEGAKYVSDTYELRHQDIRHLELTDRLAGTYQVLELYSQLTNRSLIYPFLHACSSGNIELLKYLISLGYDPKACNNSGIYHAAIGIHLPAVEFLIENGCSLAAHKDVILKKLSSNKYSWLRKFSDNMALVKMCVREGAQVCNVGNWYLLKCILLGGPEDLKYCLTVLNISLLEAGLREEIDSVVHDKRLDPEMVRKAKENVAFLESHTKIKILE